MFLQMKAKLPKYIGTYKSEVKSFELRVRLNINLLSLEKASAILLIRKLFESKSETVDFYTTSLENVVVALGIRFYIILCFLLVA